MLCLSKKAVCRDRVAYPLPSDPSMLTLKYPEPPDGDGLCLHLLACEKEGELKNSVGVDTPFS